uniref:F-box domain-containing protein n=1 Tax=Ramularia collo-cygni TaxID=112498 RepID=A0A2D3UPH0_9PEZI
MARCNLKRKAVDNAPASQEIVPQKTVRAPKKPRRDHPARPTRFTRSMKAKVPQEDVFATTELLENILIHLPKCNILTSQRVSQRFRDVIKMSVAIQKKLYLRVGGKGSSETWKGLPDGTFVRTREAPDVEMADNNNARRTKNYMVPTDSNSWFTQDSPPLATHSASNISIYTNGDWRYDDATSLEADEDMKRAMKLSLNGHYISHTLHGMQLTSSPAISIKVRVDWSMGTYERVRLSNGRFLPKPEYEPQLYGTTTVRLRNASGCTVGRALQVVRNSVAEGVNLTRSRKQIAAASVGELRRQKKYGGVVEVSSFSITLRGVLLPSDEDRKACLALPVEVDEVDEVEEVEL